MDIEESPSNQAKCKGCGNFIKKGELRGVEDENFMTYKSHKYYCKDCALKKIEESIDWLLKLKKQLKNGVVE